MKNSGADTQVCPTNLFFWYNITQMHHPYFVSRFVRTLLAVFVCIFCSTCAFAIRAIPEDNLKYPVMLALEKGPSASGFYLNKETKVLYFVTVKHVLFKKEESEKREQLQIKKNYEKESTYGSFGTICNVVLQH